MLPTKGYFQDIECPYNNSFCGRPYCHFRHRKKQSENVEEPEEINNKSDIPTYNPTPKSQLESLQTNKSHIPISYVPDLAFRSERPIRQIPKFEKPTYNPTPLSVLSAKPDTNDDLNGTKANSEYDPLKAEINFEDLTNEFDLIDEIIHEDETNVEVEPKFSDDECETIPSISIEKVEKVIEKPLSTSTKTQSSKSEVKKESTDKKNKSTSQSDNKKDKKTSSSKTTVKSSKSNTSVKDKQSSNEKYSKDKKDKSDGEKERSSDKKKSSSSSKDKKNNTLREKSRRSSETQKSESTEKKTSSNSSSSSSSKSKKDKSDDKEKSSHKENKTKVQRKKESSQDNNKHKDEPKVHKSKEKQKEKDRHKPDKKEKTSSKDRESNRDKRKESSKKHKMADKDKRDRDKKSSKNKSSQKSTSSFSSDLSNNDDSVDYSNAAFNDHEDYAPVISDIEMDDEEETMAECLKIFNEYSPKPNIPQSDKSQNSVQNHDVKQETVVYQPTSRKRTAHDGAEISQMHSKIQPPPKSKLVLTPGEILRNRYKTVRMSQQQSRNEEDIMGEIEKIVHTQSSTAKRATPPSLLEAARQLKIRKVEKKSTPSTSLVDDILNGSSRSSSSANSTPIVVRKKISAAPNVALIQKAKERISKIVSRAPAVTKTVAQTQKNNRVAHVPEHSLSDIPDVLQAAKSKLPVNVRTRFLTLIADECVKLYISRDDAYNRALNEEFACYEKCKVLVTYRNSAMLAVNRLRKELQERESKGLGLIFSGERLDGGKSSNLEGRKFYNNVVKWLMTEEELSLHGYPRESSEKGKVVVNNRKERDYSFDENHRTCCRCHKVYQVDDDGWPLYEEECMYHPLKKRTIRGEQVYLCCKTTDDSGCMTSDTHVSEAPTQDELEGYQKTLPPESDDDPRSYVVYALDCEMCYTTKGLELTRVTIVDTDCKTVYESFVKPLNPIIDYNTRFSGITAEQMNRTSTSILQVQANILHLCNSKTILVGHSLESDMKALKIVHDTVIDTSLVFPHKMGLPHKRALRALASEYLKKIIQEDVSGHDSAEDAVTCMELIKWKLKEELKVRGK